MSRIKQILTPPLLITAAVMMWAEESLWNALKTLTRVVALVPFIRRLEAMLVRLPPAVTMAAFLLPMVTLFPLKLLAVYWLTRGYWLASLALIAGAKILGTAIVARMYVVCQPKLMTIKWFCCLHDWLLFTRNRLYAALRSLPIYQQVHQRLVALKASARHYLKRFRGQRGLWFRWRAIRRLHRSRR